MPSTLTETLFSAPETAVMLRLKLGPARAWEDFLADCRRGRTSIDGKRLMPFSQARIGGCLRPFYRAADIRAFIAHCQRVGVPKSPRLTGRQFEFIDPASSTPPHWRSNVLIPIARLLAPGFMCQRNTVGVLCAT